MFGSALCAIRSCTTSVWPAPAASCIGALPPASSLVFKFIAARPSSMMWRMTVTLPFSTALWSAVAPLLSRASTCASHSSRYFTSPALSRSTAQCRGVWPERSRQLRSAPIATRYSATGTWR
eukprot:Mycagemm_TRINITY_DN9957_c0_g1::TRINITY_DN9957_c0_g1_i1::g.3441::m.3441 type:complete len:122 gc:universal TRINITY_DN9957_c0_g1_i1:666-301(-)